MLCKITKMAGDRQEQSRLITLPKTERQLNSFLMDMGIGKENDFGCMVSNIKTKNMVLDEFFNNHLASIDELNHIARFTVGFRQTDFDILADIIKAEQVQSTIDFINCMHNYDEYIFYENISTMEELGKEAAWKFDGIDPESPLRMCIDYEEYGQSFHDAHRGIFSGNRYIIPPQGVSPVYDGMMLPWNVEQNNGVMSLLISRHDLIENAMNNDACGPTGIWIHLPVMEYEIERAFHRLGIENPEDSIIYTGGMRCGEDIDTLFERSDPLKEINALAEVISMFRGKEMDKFLAVARYEQEASLPELINCAYNLDCYEYNPEIITPEDFVIHTYGDDSVKLARADELDGEKLLAKCSGKITIYGFVARNETPMKQVYEPVNTPGGDMNMSM